MPKFILEINLGNDGAKTDIHIAAILDRAVRVVLFNGTSVPKELCDINGNVVGHYEVV